MLDLSWGVQAVGFEGSCEQCAWNGGKWARYRSGMSVGVSASTFIYTIVVGYMSGIRLHVVL